MPRNDDLQDRIGALIVLWRGALAGPQHAAGCNCMGAFLMPPPTARDLEEDVLDYLCHRYATAGEPVATALLQAREAELRQGTNSGFADFLRNLERALPAPARDRLLDDLATTLASFAAPAAPAGRFTCT